MNDELAEALARQRNLFANEAAVLAAQLKEAQKQIAALQEEIARLKKRKEPKAQ